MLDRAIMTTVVNPGLAGAPLFDAGRARLIGVVSLGLAAVGRYSLAIPIDLFLRRREELEAGEPRAARTPRAWVGFYPQAHDGGVVVTGVVPGGPGRAAGLAARRRGAARWTASRSPRCASCTSGPVAQAARRGRWASRCCATPRSAWSRCRPATATSSTSEVLVAMSILKVARIGHPVVRSDGPRARPRRARLARAPDADRRHGRDDARVRRRRPGGAAGPRGPAAGGARGAGLRRARRRRRAADRAGQPEGHAARRRRRSRAGRAASRSRTCAGWCRASSACGSRRSTATGKPLRGRGRGLLRARHPARVRPPGRQRLPRPHEGHAQPRASSTSSSATCSTHEDEEAE